MSKYATGKYAIGLCDICGFQYKLTDLRMPSVRGRPTGLLSCPTCFDPDHPQNFLGLVKVNDPQAVKDARPDPALAASRAIIVSVQPFQLSGYTAIYSAVGRVTVTT